MYNNFMLIVLTLLILVVLALAYEVLPPDSVILLAIVALVTLGILTPQEAFSGFGSSLIVILVSIFIIGGALKYNGVVEFIANKLTKVKTKNYAQLLPIIMLPTGLLSAFMSNTSVVALTVQSVKSFAEKINMPPSKFLMPLAFASLLGGTCTLIGTSTNIVGSNFLVSKGYPAIGMFEFLPIGLVLLFFTTLFFIFFGEKIFGNVLNVNNISEEDTKIPRQYFSDFVIYPNSKLLGKNGKYLFGQDITFLCIENEGGIQNTDTDKTFQVNDKIYIQGTNDNIKKFYNNFALGNFHTHKHFRNSKIVEMLVLPSCTLLDKSLKETQFYQHTGLKVMAIFRKNCKYEKSLNKMSIKVGDILICEGEEEDINKVIYNNDFIILNHKNKSEHPNLQKGFLILGIFFLSIIISALEILPVSISLLLAIMFMIAINIIPTQEVFSNVDWRLIILIGGMSAFGVAVTKTGMDTFLANFLLENFTNINSLLLVFIFMIITVLLTQPMSNAAAALVMLPIGLQTANSFGIDPRGFAVAIILAASISMITPFEPASLLVLKPGNYKVKDFFRIGGFLTICCLIIILGIVNYIYL